MRVVSVLTVMLVWALPVFADTKVERLAQALQLNQIMQILAQEGDQQRIELDKTLLNNQGGDYFEVRVAEIYDTTWMRTQLVDAFTRTMTDVQMDQAIVFFESDLGQTIISLENSARQAMSDSTIEDMAREAYRDAPRESVLYELVDEYIEVNDLIEQNVQNSLSADYSFFKGLDLDNRTSDDDILSELLTQQDSMTEDTTTWLFSFFLMAYDPLNEAQMRENIAFSRTETGRALNQALFEGFDIMYDRISYQLGEAVALVLRGSDL